MSWVTDFALMLAFQELTPPIEWTVNTLSEIDLVSKIEQFRAKRTDISRRELHGDEYALARELIDWLDYRIALLQHWLDTLPAVGVRPVDEGDKEGMVASGSG